MHYQRLKKNGTLELAPKPEHCLIQACSIELGAGQGRGFCRIHYQRFFRIFMTPECSIDGCETIVRARNLCATHYSRWRRKGDPLHRLQGEVVNGKRICARCGEDKPLETGWGLRVAPGGYCLLCAAAIKRERWTSGLVDREKSWASQAGRRAAMRAQHVESFTRLEIYERDSWKCGICGEGISPSAKRPDPRSASIDHIIPISKGGEHSRANAQASHFRCNLQKGDRVA